jgi:Zn ribbon nucleic-acid-binding protein
VKLEEVKTQPVECKCGHAHKNAPKDVLGCGGSGRVELTK